MTDASIENPMLLELQSEIHSLIERVSFLESQLNQHVGTPAFLAHRAMSETEVQAQRLKDYGSCDSFQQNGASNE